MARPARRFPPLLAVLLLLCGVAVLAVSSLRRHYVYYLTVEEFLARPEALAGERSNVSGRLCRGSLSRRSADPPVYEFSICGSRGQLPVRYAGILPDLLRDDGEVVAEGRYREGLFSAQRLLAKCPSKYEAQGPRPERSGR